MVALAKAYKWQDELESGQYTSLEDLAAANKVDRTYVGWILRLTSLAPDIVEAILRDAVPEGMSLAKLRKNIPRLWSELATKAGVSRPDVEEATITVPDTFSARDEIAARQSIRTVPIAHMVPEPGGLLLAGAGMLLLAGTRRKWVDFRIACR